MTAAGGSPTRGRAALPHERRHHRRLKTSRKPLRQRRQGSSSPWNLLTRASPRRQATWWFPTKANFPAPSRPSWKPRVAWPGPSRRSKHSPHARNMAQQNKAKITQQMETDKQKIADTKKLIGQIATQAYKSGGVPSNLSPVLWFQQWRKPDRDHGFGGPGHAEPKRSHGQAAAAERHQRELRRPACKRWKLRSRTSKPRLTQHLKREKAARDEAAAKKEEVDRLIADTSRLDARVAGSQAWHPVASSPVSRRAETRSLPKSRSATGSCAKPGKPSSGG